MRNPDPHLTRLARLLTGLTLLEPGLSLLLLLPLHLLLATGWNHHPLGRLLPLHHLLLLHLLLLSLGHHLLGVPHLLFPLNLLEEEIPLARLHVVQHFPLLVGQSDGLLHHLLLRIGQEEAFLGEILLLFSRVHLGEVVPLLWSQVGDVLLDNLLLPDHVRSWLPLLRTAGPHHGPLLVPLSRLALHHLGSHLIHGLIGILLAHLVVPLLLVLVSLLPLLLLLTHLARRTTLLRLTRLNYLAWLTWLH